MGSRAVVAKDNHKDRPDVLAAIFHRGLDALNASGRQDESD